MSPEAALTCPTCGEQGEGGSGATFCSRCGAALTGTCPTCGAGFDATARFCESCGLNLAAARSRAPRPLPVDAPPQRCASRRRVRRWRDFSSKEKRRTIAFLAVFYPTAALIALLVVVLPSTNSSASATQLPGVAIVAGPLQGATVHVYSLGSHGQEAGLLATARTDANGYYSLQFSRPAGQPVLVVTSGGSYLDEVSGKRVVAAAGQYLESIVTPHSEAGLLTPLTTFAAASALGAAAAGQPLSTSVAVSYSAVARNLDLVTLTAVVPAVADSAQNVAASDWQGRQQGVELAGLDQEAGSLGVSPLALADAVAADLSDGNLDGKKGSAAVRVGGRTLPAGALTGLLQQAMSVFAASPADQAPHVLVPPLPATDVFTWPGGVPPSSLGGATYAFYYGGIFTFTDGKPGVGLLEGSMHGGTGPYYCRVSKGAMPSGFDWDPPSGRSCIIGYDGQPHLSGDEVEFISNPFDVTVTDSSEPPKSWVIAQERIATLRRSPTIEVQGAHCTVGEPCPPQVIATASGGVRDDGSSSYRFVTSVTDPLAVPTQADRAPGLLDGSYAIPQIFPEIETRRDQAILTGTPTRAGTYHIYICVIDSAGLEGCQSTTVTVGPATSNGGPFGTYDLAIQMSWTWHGEETEHLSASGSATISLTEFGGASGTGSIHWSASFSGGMCSVPPVNATEADRWAGTVSGDKLSLIWNATPPRPAPLETCPPPHIPQTYPASWIAEPQDLINAFVGRFDFYTLELSDQRPQTFSFSNDGSGTVTITLTPAG